MGCLIHKYKGCLLWRAVIDPLLRKLLSAAMHDNIHLKLGEAACVALSNNEKEGIDFFICTRCCMHKEMNFEKGGAAEIALYWIRAGIPGPVKLMNKDNVAVASLGPSDANKSTTEVSQNGAVRATSLAVAIFCNKDDKKDQQDALHHFFEAELG